MGRWLNPRPRSVQLSTAQVVRAALAALLSAPLALLLAAGDVVVLDGTVQIAGRARGEARGAAAGRPAPAAT